MVSPPPHIAKQLSNQLAELDQSLLRQPEQARPLIERALEQAQAMSDHQLEAYARFLLSACALFECQYQVCINQGNKAMELAQQLGDLNLESRTANILALGHQRLGIFDKALEWFLLALKIAVEQGDDAGHYRALHNLAIFQSETGHYEPALEFDQQALNIARTIHNSAFIAASMTTQVGFLNRLQRYQEAAELGEGSLDLVRAEKIPKYECELLDEISFAYVNLGRLEQGLQVSLLALALAHEHQDQESLAYAGLAVGRAYAHLNQTATAIEHLHTSLGISQHIGNRPLSSDILLLLAKTYAQHGDFAEAYGYSWQHFELERSLHSQDVELRSQSLSAQVKVELLERQAELERLRNNELAQVNMALRQAQDALIYRANHDDLTGLVNRAAFQQKLQATVNRLSYGEQAALIFVDLDQFKAVNDLYGHAAGDELLRQVAARLRDHVRAESVVARVGGDEFTILLEHIQPAQVKPIIERLFHSLAEPFLVAERELEITASMGYAICPDDGTDADVLLRNADIAMYRVKRRGKNDVLRFDRSMMAAKEQHPHVTSDIVPVVRNG